MPRPGKYAAVFLSGPVCVLIRGYRLLISPVLGPRCRHLPTCSDYALQALEEHGAVAGVWLALKRICRCHPWGTSGYDPVPDRSGQVGS
jgi:putative membrane protein insertion efficiency factor